MAVLYRQDSYGDGLHVFFGTYYRQQGGDIVVERSNFSFYFPLASSIIVSIILTLLLAYFRR